MKTILRNTVIAASIALSGCSNGIPEFKYKSLSSNATSTTHKVFIGIPLLASLEGSYVSLDSEWSLTAAHNKTLLSPLGIEAYYHETCDVALIRKGGKSSKLGYSYFGETLYHVGYPVGIPLSVSDGVLINNIEIDNYKGCVKGVTDGVIFSGMSGGGVYNSSGNVIGINHGFVLGGIDWGNGESSSNVAVFTYTENIRDWIIEITGNDYF